MAQGARRDSEFMLVINGNPRSRRQVGSMILLPKVDSSSWKWMKMDENGQFGVLSRKFNAMHLPGTDF